MFRLTMKPLVRVHRPCHFLSVARASRPLRQFTTAGVEQTRSDLQPQFSDIPEETKQVGLLERIRSNPYWQESIDYQISHALQRRCDNHHFPLTGHRAVDCGCGRGRTSRLLKELGAEFVLGMDISEEKIRHAKPQHCTTIQYKQFDLSLPNLKLTGAPFDVAISCFVTVYAQSPQELQIMINNAYQNLNPGGLVLFLFPIYRGAIHSALEVKYAYKLDFEGSPFEGSHHQNSEARVTMWDWPKTGEADFHLYWWTEDEYEKHFAAAGFVDIVWHKTVCSAESREQFGEEFANAVERGYSQVVTARIPRST